MRHGVGTLTLYAFSADNWYRPHAEVEALFGLLRRYLITETDRCRRESIRLNIIGRRDRLSQPLRRQIERSERLTPPAPGCICASPSITPRATACSRPRAG